MVGSCRLRRLAASLTLASLVAGQATAALAACPIELATYADSDGLAELEFMPTKGAATVSNTFKLLLGGDVVMDGIVQWTQEASRPYGMLMYKCPEGDVTGEEMDACTAWQGVVYTANESGTIGLLPAEGAEAPKTLVLSDLAASLRLSKAFGAGGFSKLPSDVFALKGCQE